MTVAGLQLPPEDSLYPTTTLLDCLLATLIASKLPIANGYIKYEWIEVSRNEGCYYESYKRLLTSQSSRIRAGRGGTVFGAVAAAAESIVMVDRPCGIRMDILQDPSTTRHVKKHRSYTRGAPTNTCPVS